MVVQYFKYDGTLHWRHDSVHLGEDEHGTWLGAPAGSTVQRGEKPAIAWPTAWVQLVVPGAWWTMIYNGEAERHRTYTDIVMPARWVAEDRVEMVDLDLDVIGRRDGSAFVDDEDEFEEHRVAMGYPDTVVDGARAAANNVLSNVRTSVEPFGDAGAPWLALVTGH